MTETKVYYIENSNELNEVLKKIRKVARVERKLIEMDYSEVTITTAGIVGIAQIEKYLARLV